VRYSRGIDRSAAAGTIRRGRILATLVLAGLTLALAPAASTFAASFTWAGRSPGTTEAAAHWSSGVNWEGGVAPTASQAIETLTFPHLTNGECTSFPETDTCYATLNDLTGLSVEKMSLDDGDSYLLAGEGITLGSGGLTAAPSAGTSGLALSFMVMPLQLGASQTWSVANRGGEIEENILLVGSEIMGAGRALTVELSNGPAIVLEKNSTEVGPVTIEGQSAAKKNIANGLAILEEGQLNSANGEPVELSHVFFAGTGALGALRTSHATLEVGSRRSPAGALEASSVKLDTETGAIFNVVGSGTSAQTDYSQLVSRGSVEVAGPIVVFVEKPSKTAACPVLTPGQKYTFISTTGTLSGVFANALEGGPEVKIAFGKHCEHPEQTMRISYIRSGATKMVVGTVEAHLIETREAEAKEKETREREARERETKEKEQAITKQAEEHAKKVAEEVTAAAAAANRKHEEELAATTRRLETEIAARGGVAGSKEHSQPKPPTRAQLLAKALKQCKKQPKRKRTQCAAKAQRRYGSGSGRKKGKRH
jgi:hypothetical protein